MAACLAHGWVVSESAFFCRKLLGTLQVGSHASGVQRPSHSSGPHLPSRKFQSHPDVPPVWLIELAPSDVSRDVLAAYDTTHVHRERCLWESNPAGPPTGRQYGGR